MRHWCYIGRPRPAALRPSPQVETPFVFTPFDVNHILSTGQSLSVGATSTAASLTQPFGNLMLSTGVQGTTFLSSAFLPLVESGVETMSSSLANRLTEMALADGITPFVSLVSVHGAGGTPYSGIKKGTTPYANGMAQLAGAKARATTNGQSYVVRCVTCVHGESDSLDGSTTYEADMIEFQADYESDVQAATGQTLPVPMFHSQNSFFAQSRIPLDMLAAHKNAPGKAILVCPKYHLSSVSSDNVHLTAAGYRHLGEEYAKAYRKVVLEGGTWEPLRPKLVTRVGNVITIQFYVPHAPIVLDTTLVAMTAHYGFDYVDDTTAAAQPASGGQNPTVSSVAVIDDDKVQITLSGTPTVPGRIRYGIYWNEATGPRGNLRDSDPTSSRFGFDLSNWCVQFEEPIAV